MKDLSQVLREKERDVERVRKEIEALHFVIPLLAEDADWIENGRGFEQLELRVLDRLRLPGRPKSEGYGRASRMQGLQRTCASGIDAICGNPAWRTILNPAMIANAPRPRTDCG